VTLRVAVGTCGFSYADWVGPFYPPKTKPGEMLAEYARRFTVVEIDSSYYRVPSENTVRSWARRSPEDFRFSLKLPATVTHLPAAAYGTLHDDLHEFRRNVTPLADAGKLACVLLQFPNRFRPNEQTTEHIRRLRDALDDMRLVAEFRHREWQTHDTLVLLRDLQIGLVAVDEPEYASLPRPTTDVTSDLAYVRLHGRNAAAWWTGDNVTRYDYRYSLEELGPWADRIVDFSANPEVTEVLSFFNNHRRGAAAANAEMLEAMLATRFPAAVIRTRPRDTGAAPQLPLFTPAADLGNA